MLVILKITYTAKVDQLERQSPTADPAGRRGLAFKWVSQTLRILKFVVGFFGMDSGFLTKGNILISCDDIWE
jgi:hypothetical protein